MPMMSNGPEHAHELPTTEHHRTPGPTDRPNEQNVPVLPDSLTDAPLSILDLVELACADDVLERDAWEQVDHELTGRADQHVGVTVYVRSMALPPEDYANCGYQERLCRAAVEARGWYVERVLGDTAFSQRAAFETLCTLIEREATDAVVVLERSRLARRLETLRAIVELAKEHGVALLVCEGPDLMEPPGEAATPA